MPDVTPQFGSSAWDTAMQQIRNQDAISRAVNSSIRYSPAPDPSPTQTAENTRRVAESTSELVQLINASLLLSEQMRDTADQAAKASTRIGRHALVIAYVSAAAAIGAVVVSVVALVNH